MTDRQAKAAAVKSIRRGRKRAYNLVTRVVSYFLDGYTARAIIATRSGLEADIRRALMDVSHPARDYSRVDKFIEQILSDDLLDGGCGSFTINF